MDLSIFRYGDYRTFLRDYHELKKRKRGWSYSVWASQLKLRSRSTLTMILQGQRRPGPQLVAALADYFGFDEKEREHFRNLVLLSRHESDSQLSALLVGELAKNCARGGFLRLTHDKFSAISEWYYYALREMVGLEGFRENATWLAQRFRFPVSSGQIKEAIATLLRLGLLRRDRRGRLETVTAHVDTSSDFADEGLKRFHEQALENARLAVREVPPEARELQGTTFVLSAASLPRAKELLRKLRDEFCDAMENREGNAIYHLEIALYPVAELPRKPDGKRSPT